jgi:hypothetical protein
LDLARALAGAELDHSAERVVDRAYAWTCECAFDRCHEGVSLSTAEYRPHDLVVVDQKRDLAVDQDLGALSAPAVAAGRGVTGGPQPSLRLRVEKAGLVERRRFI